MTERIMPPVHPGEILEEEFLAPMGLTAGKLALELGVPPQRLYEIIAGKRGVTMDTALRLAAFFDMSHEFFLGLQAQYEFQLAQDKGLVERVAREVRPLRKEALED